MNIDLTAIFQAILALLAAIITYKVIPWIKARTTSEQQSLLKATVRTLVYAAEQLYGAGEGAKKLDFVIQQLEKQGFTASRVEVEAAVGEYINGWKKFETDSGAAEDDAEDDEVEELNPEEKPPDE